MTLVWVLVCLLAEQLGEAGQGGQFDIRADILGEIDSGSCTIGIVEISYRTKCYPIAIDPHSRDTQRLGGDDVVIEALGDMEDASAGQVEGLHRVPEVSDGGFITLCVLACDDGCEIKVIVAQKFGVDRFEEIAVDI